MNRDQYRIGYKMKTYLPGKTLRFKVTSDCIGDLFLEFAQVLALRCNSAFASGSVPGRDKESGFLTGFDLKYYFFHIHQRTTQTRSPSIARQAEIGKVSTCMTVSRFWKRTDL